MIGFAPHASRSEAATEPLLRDDEMEDREPALWISPNPGGFAETGRRRQARESFQGMLVGEFGDDRFASRKLEFLAADPHGLVRLADEMHLDAAFALIVNGLMPPERKIEIRAELAVGAGEQIEVELGRHPGAVIVGGLQDFAVFLEIHPDDKTAALPA